MSLIMGDDRARTPARRPALVAVVVVLLIVGAGLAFLLGRANTVPATAPEPGVLRWTEVGASVVPSGQQVGPHEIDHGAARGFSHDAVGAAVAALNISARLTPAAGDAVLQQTARTQCFGDPDAAIAAAQRQSTAASTQSVRPTAYWFRVVDGTAAGSLVVVDVAAETPQATASGGYVHFERTLRWTDGDWQMQVPVSRPAITTSVAAYQYLGRP